VKRLVHAERKKVDNVATAHVLRWKGQQPRGHSFFVTALGSYCFKRLIGVNGFFYKFNDLKDYDTETTALNFLYDKITQKAGFWFRLHRLV
jgi:hypothetical protein